MLDNFKISVKKHTQTFTNYYCSKQITIMNFSDKIKQILQDYKNLQFFF